MHSVTLKLWPPTNIIAACISRPKDMVGNLSWREMVGFVILGPSAGEEIGDIETSDQDFFIWFTSFGDWIINFV